MIVEQHSVGAATRQLSENHRWGTLYDESLRAKARLAQQQLDKVGHLGYAPTLCCHARLTTELLKQRLCVIYVFVKIRG